MLSIRQGNSIDQANAQSAIKVLSQLAGDPTVQLSNENRAAIAYLGGKNVLDYVDWNQKPSSAIPSSTSSNGSFASNWSYMGSNASGVGLGTPDNRSASQIDASVKDTAYSFLLSPLAATAIAYAPVPALASGALDLGIQKLDGKDVSLTEIMFSMATGPIGLGVTTEKQAVGVVTNSKAPFSRLVDGGGLQAHENAGGHLLEKHVGQTEQDLMTRLANEPKISGSSSFYDRATAENALSQTLDVNQSVVQNWLNGTSNRLRLDYSSSSPVGISVTRGAAGAVDASSARAILLRDPSMPTGYKILTGFPTLP
ncbi:RNase A-like domain-containing protein [Dechloromonas denitrificans]|uniref:RNase A-like domain-containing protein n=1 Tax=Dechloromonas denitrificans TaxID=281362 RepID=UPI001CF888B0|nr:RNase A-like domain-containing protein [Dechloromonas denitrificans]UCV04243.1 hypothetical protein KI611_02945 [Dechloromonas denitrificans]